MREETLPDEPDWCILRSSLVYGPGNPGNMARLLKLLKTGLPLPLGSVRNQRSFIFVGNLVDAIETVLAHPSASRKIFLMSDGEHLSTPQLIYRLADKARCSARLFPVPVGILKLLGKAGDNIERLLKISIGVDTYSIGRLVGSLSVDSSLIAREAEWFPPYRMEHGLEMTFKETNTGKGDV